jgi:hypothetical protein
MDEKENMDITGVAVNSIIWQNQIEPNLSIIQQWEAQQCLSFTRPDSHVDPEQRTTHFYCSIGSSSSG